MPPRTATRTQGNGHAAITGAVLKDPEEELAKAQSYSEGVPHSARTVEFQGKRFRIAGKVGLFPLMKFAAAADTGMDTSDMAALAAIYAMLQDCIQAEVPACGKCEGCTSDPPDTCPLADPGDWHKFEAHAIATKADADDLLPVVQQTIEVLTARPTRPPSGSSRP